MVKNYKSIIKSHFNERGFFGANIKSFDNFIDVELQKIVEEIGEIRPTIVPDGVEDFVIKVNKIEIGEPQLIEADGSKRNIFPIEARLRKLTYSAPLFLEVSAHVDGLQIENFTTQIGKIPIMVGSKHCNSSKLNRNERVLVMVEDLASNRVFVEKTSIGPSEYSLRVFSEGGSLRIPHTIEQMKEGVIFLSFTRLKRIPIMAVIKALGLNSDQDIAAMINTDKDYEDVFINMYKVIELKTREDALELIGKQMGITQGREIKVERAE